MNDNVGRRDNEFPSRNDPCKDLTSVPSRAGKSPGIGVHLFTPFIVSFSWRESGWCVLRGLLSY